jgi:Arc/MetJ family transcription regulator
MCGVRRRLSREERHEYPAQGAGSGKLVHQVIGTAASIETMLKSALEDGTMRTTIALDDDLIRQAQEYTGITEKAVLVREALKQLVQREAARRLAALGGTMPDLKPIPRRRMLRK